MAVAGKKRGSSRDDSVIYVDFDIHELMMLFRAIDNKCKRQQRYQRIQKRKACKDGR